MEQNKCLKILVWGFSLKEYLRIQNWFWQKTKLLTIHSYCYSETKLLSFAPKQKSAVFHVTETKEIFWIKIELSTQGTVCPPKWTTWRNVRCFCIPIYPSWPQFLCLINQYGCHDVTRHVWHRHLFQYGRH